MKRILIILGLLLSNATIESVYNVGTIDSISGTNNGGTGYGNATQASAVGYVIPGFTDNTSLNGSAIQPDGKAIIVGVDVTPSPSEALIARLNINGTLDTTTFGSPHGYVFFAIPTATTTVANAVTVLPNGKIVVVGYAVVSGSSQFFVAQFLADGTLDTTGTDFASGTGYVLQSNIATLSADVANAVTVDSSGNLYVVGTSTQSSFGNVFVARYTNLGVLDSTYNSDAIVGGSTGSGTTIAGIGMLSIGGSTSLTGQAIAIDTYDSGYIVVAGSVGPASMVGRFTNGTGSASGVLDTTGFNNPYGYNTQGSSSTIGYSIGFQSIAPNVGKIIVAGFDNPNALVLRYTTAGLLDSHANNPTSPFGIGGAGSQTGYITSNFGGTSATARGVAIQSDDKIIIGGNVTISSVQKFLIARYLADGSALDTANFAPSQGYTTSVISSPSIGNTLSMQQNGSCILAGTVFTTHNAFGVARYLGDIPQGCMDYTYNQAVASSPGTPGFSIYPTDSTAADKPEVTALQALPNNTVYVVTKEVGTTTGSRLVQLNADGSTALAAVDCTKVGATDVIVDSKSRALVVGTASGAGWLRRSTSSTSLTADSTFGSSGFVVETTNSSSFRRVGEQAAGRIVVIGQASSPNQSFGLLIAYDEHGDLATSATSVPFGTGQTGFYTLGTENFYDMIIDSDDGIYVAYSSPGDFIYIAKFLANGSGLDTSFGSTSSIPGTINTNQATDDNQSNIVLSFDTSGNIILGIVSTGGNFQFFQYTPTSTIASGSGTIPPVENLLSSPILTKLQCDTNNKPIFAGYDNNVFFVGRLETAGSSYLVDTTFAPYSSSPGILKTMYNDVNPSRVNNGVCISPSGAILFGGYENIDGSDTVSVVGNIVGTEGGSPASQVARYPGAIINSTGTVSGTINLTTSASLTDGHPEAIYSFGSGTFSGYTLVANTNGTSTILSMLDATTYALNTSTGATSFGTGDSGYVTLPSVVTPTQIFIDVVGNIYVLGTTSGGAVAVDLINSAGTSTSSLSLPTPSATAGLTVAYDIVQQASGRILIAGYNSNASGGAGSGVVVAYDPVLGAIDTSFNSSGTPGYWYTGIAYPIMSISVGATNNAQLNADKIYMTYQSNSTTVAVELLLENGTALDTTFTTIAASLTPTSDTNLSMQLDVNGAIVLVVNTSTGVQAARYNSDGTIGGTYGIAAAVIIPSSYSPILQEILTLSDGTTLLLACNSSTLNIARLNSSFAPDTTFNTGGLTTGLLSTTVSPQVEFWVMDVFGGAPGIIVSGDTNTTAGSAAPYLTEIVNNDTVTKVSQSATATPAAGTLDTTLNPAGSTAGFMNLGAELQTTQFPSATTIRALLQNPNGTYYIAGSTSSNSYVTMMSDDDVQQTGFGTSGLLTLSGKTNLSAMLLAQNGGMFIVGGSGSSGSNAGWLNYVNTINGTTISDFAVTTTLDVCTAIAQQKNQRIIVAGEQAGTGALIAYNSVTGAVDTTFGVNGVYTATGYGAINSIVVDATDSIYFVVNEQGGAPDRGFIMGVNPSGTSIKFSPNNIITSSTVAANNHVVLDQAGNLTVVGVDTTDNTIVIKTCLSSNGAVTDSCTLTQTGAASVATGIVTPNVTDILVDLNASPGKVIVTGYDSSTSPSTPFVLRVQAAVSSGLDTTFNSGGGNPGVQTYDTLTSGITTNWYASMVNADGKITVAGYASALTTPYMMRVYGDEFIGQYSPSLTPLPAGTPGTIDTTFGTSGEILLAGLSGGGALVGALPIVVLPIMNGDYYIALNNPISVLTQIIRLTNGAALDGTFGSSGFATNLVPGVMDMIIDGSNQLVVAGTNTTGSPYGWITRYESGNAGTLDATFNGGGIVSFDPVVVVNKIVQQTLGRYVLAGQLTGLSGNGGLVAVVSGGAHAGLIDTTFNSNGANPGYYDSGITTEIYALISDVYDRLIIAYKHGSGIDIRRITSAGQIDTTFGSAGTITGAIANADDATQVCLTFDDLGNIVLAAHINDGANKIAVKAYANTTGTTVVETELDIVGLTAPILTNVIAVSDGKILLSGYQSGTNNMWVACMQDNGSGAYQFNPLFGVSGMMQFSFDGSATARDLTSIAIYGDGQIAIVGTETDGTVNPFLSMAYNDPYTSQEIICQDLKPDGTNDTTLGASSATATALGVTFFASAGAAANSGQVARAIALQDDENIVVAVDGGASAGSATPSYIFISMFNVDGLLNTSFNSTGYATVLSSYENQHATDMVTFTTVAGVHKTILAGYATDAGLGITGSLLLQYNLTSPGLDTANFGGFDSNLPGIAFGDAQQAFVVGQQSSGRIVVGGLTQNNLGVLLGYTADGKLDTSFGSDGIQSSNTGTTGIYTHAIDNQNRVVIAYNNGEVDASLNCLAVTRFLADGSGVDSSFAGIQDNTLSGLVSNSAMKVAVDSSNNVYVAAVYNFGQDIFLASFNNITGDLNYYANFSNGAGLDFTLGRVIIDQSGNVIIVASESTNVETYVIRYTSIPLLALDTSNFNAPHGFITYQVAGGSTSQVATDALIHPDGRILVVGSED